jgi:hypothetical protein
MRHALIAVQLQRQAQAALHADGNEPRTQAGNSNHRRRQMLVGGVLALLALVASATVVGGPTW